MNIIQTVAGNIPINIINNDYSGDGGSLPASKGYMKGPTGMFAKITTDPISMTTAIDYILFADTDNNRIRKIMIAPEDRGLSQTQQCPTGTYMPWEGSAALEDCLLCTPGYYCSTTGAEVPTGECSPGYYCPSGAKLPNENPCTVGHFCVAGSPAPESCKAGFYQDETTQSDCKNCPEGYYCDGNAPSNEVPQNCPEGYYCPEYTKWATQNPCPPGTYSNLTNLKNIDECVMCDIGKYCSTPGLKQPTDSCYPGFYCAGYAWLPAPTFDDIQWWPTPLTFDVTKYPGNRCPAGSYCPGNVLPLPCPSGTFSTTEGAVQESDCILCDPGKYCTGLGSSIDCEGGYVCTGGSSIQNPESVHGYRCNEGYYCPAGALDQKPCRPGYYSGAGQEICTPCDSGFICPNQGMSAVGSACPQGHKCPIGSISAIPCPPGTMQSAPAQGECELCTPGMYCDDYAQMLPKGQCEEGYVCSMGAIYATPSDGIFGNNNITNGYCPIGHMCDIGTYIPTKCNPGTYQDGYGQSKCKSCAPGSYCIDYGLNSTMGSGLCDAGYYCRQGNIQSNPSNDPSLGGLCPSGFVCPSGTAAPQNCPKGEYTSKQGQIKCDKCLEGFRCFGNSPNPQPCPGGMYCPEGSYLGNVCPLGSYLTSDTTFATKIEDCQPCPKSKYCRGGFILGSCSAGYLCGRGIAYANPDPTESTIHVYIGSGIVDMDYDVTNFNPENEDELGGIPCPPGYYCPEGTVTPHECPDNSVRLFSGGRFSTDCTACPAGYYCLPGELVPRICLEGYYCPQGSDEPTACPIPFYNPTQGAEDLGACLLCPPGVWCQEEGTGLLTKVPKCPKGFYCVEGTVDPIPCPPGTFGFREGQESASGCEDCTGGYFCNLNSNTSPSELCPTGHYCPIKTAIPKICPAGTYCPNKGTIIPLTCPAGYKCEAGTGDPISCDIGYYCEEGAIVETPCSPGYTGIITDNTLLSIMTYLSNNSDILDRLLIDLKDDLQSIITDIESKQINNINSICKSAQNFDEKWSLLQTNNDSIYILLKQFESIRESIPPNSIFDDTFRISEEKACKPCVKGSYQNREGMLVCEKCEPGFLCFEGTNKQYPVDRELDNGTWCPQGHYCPEGSYEPTECIEGTFNNRLRQPALSSCIPCRAGSFNEVTGQTACRPCGASSTSPEGSTTCNCIGGNRAFQESDMTCICLPGFELISNGVKLNDDDGDLDCVPMVYPRCGKVRDHATGQCVNEECDEECGSVGGVRQASTGICVCNELPITSVVCDVSCREEQIQARVDEDLMIFKLPDGTEESYSIPELAGESGFLANAPVCDREKLAAGLSECEISFQSTTKGSFEGYFGVPFELLTKIRNTLKPVNSPEDSDSRRLSQAAPLDASRKLQAAPPDASVTSPVQCLELGWSMVWYIGGGKNYPKYNKDSLLNSNQDFDFGPFRRLAIDIEAGIPRELFAYSFTTPGVHVFSMSEDENQQSIVSVMDTGHQAGH
eukprot:GHVL01026433.1.p1 GENE.GHVL01026433.1~~GHVL01026433.1.p1  ORF type:complete len:1507 (+),score=344.66 GHVL01026433.1:59-4522(+)